MLGEIRSAVKVLQGLEADDMDSLSETKKALKGVQSLQENVNDLAAALENRVEYLTAMGIEEEEEESGEPVG